MKYRELGRTGIPVSEIGFGGWGIGGRTDGLTSYGETDDSLSLRTIDAALEHGITLFDTAALYGHGHSEVLIGRACTPSKRDRAVIATKAGYTRYDAPADYSPANIRLSLTASLQRLGTDYVDVLMLHDAPPTQLQEDPAILETLNALVKEGLVRASGASVKSPDHALSMIRDFGIPIVQLNFNMMDTRAQTSGLLDIAASVGAGVIARTPLCFGFLSGAITRETEFAPGDHRHRWSRRQIERWIEGAEMLRGVLPEVERDDIYRTALRFCLSYPISSVIPGMLSPQEVAANAPASDMGALASGTLDAIAKVNANNEFFVRG